MGGHHQHHHHHDHHHHSHASHSTAKYSKAFLIGIFLNSSFVLIEAYYGYWSGSLGLLADAGHNLSDVLGLVLAFLASNLSRKKSSLRYTYGLRSTTIFASLCNFIFLILTVLGISFEAIERLQNPTTLNSSTVMMVATVGIIVNSFTALLFREGRKNDLNIQGAFTHMVTDALISLGVVISGGIITYTGYTWPDPVISLLIGLVILFGTWRPLRDSLQLALHGVPGNIDLAAVQSYLSKLEGVKRVHDLHVWAVSTTETALTVHLVIPAGHPGDGLLAEVAEELEKKYSIHHVTIQIEVGDQQVLCPHASEAGDCQRR